MVAPPSSTFHLVVTFAALLDTVQANDGATAPCSLANFSKLPFCNKSLPIDARVADAVSRMTLAEKIANLQNNAKGIPSLGLKQLEYSEGLHGVFSGCAKQPVAGSTGCPTAFPAPIGLGATYNRSLWQAIGNAIGREGRALHNLEHGSGIDAGNVGLMFWSPDINLFRDPRWGRGQEVPGEDTFLTSSYVAQYSTGLQGNDEAYMQIGSTCKHFSAYDMENSDGVSRNRFDAKVSPRDLVEYYWPVFEACVKEAKVASVMCSYNAVNGVPSCANGRFQNDLLREEWGFDGFVVSDCGAIGNVAHEHNYTGGDESKAAAVSLKGGTDVDCGSIYPNKMQDALNKQLVNISDIDRAISRQLKAFIRLGELEGPNEVSYQNFGAESVDTPAHRALALNAAEESIVLLKNDGTLPLSKDKKLAFVGPHANATRTMLSDYFGTSHIVDTHSPLQAAVRAGLSVTYAPGHDLDPNSKNLSLLPMAVAAAKAADIAVIFVGLCADNCATRIEDEGQDRKNLIFPGAQDKLIEAVIAAGRPTIVVLLNTGGPIDIYVPKGKANAILHAFYPGEFGGDAVVNTLLGIANPSGRLPYTMYPNAVTINRKMTDMDLRSVEGLTYKWYTGNTSGPPLYEFGFGMSYTSFKVEWSDIQGPAVTQLSVADAATSELSYCVNVTNTGEREGSYSVLAFVEGDGVLRPIKSLFGFEKVRLQPGESRSLIITTTPAKAFATVDESGRRLLHPGRYAVTIGDGALRTTATLVGTTRVLAEYPGLESQPRPAPRVYV
jgi:beta-glucosidase-like glycosyl hydrolase